MHRSENIWCKMGVKNQQLNNLKIQMENFQYLLKNKNAKQQPFCLLSGVL